MSNAPAHGWDVIVVGYGPVGMCTAALLARSGHRVLVLERHAGLYNLPRAAIFDDEIMRFFARLGIAEHMLPKIHASRNYEWRNGSGELLIEHDFALVGRSGWSEWYHMYQPNLEDALHATCRATGRVEVRFDARVTTYEDVADGVRVTTEGGESFTGRWVVACDGGNSFTRRYFDIGQTDFGFSEPWMVCDFELTGSPSIPMARQVCNPKQPVSIISLGPAHHRFSFMLDSEAAFDSECAPERVWKRVEPYLQPKDAKLIRVATYTFRSLVAHVWRRGRVLLAGDAAHQMPPFLGQGMCSGIRDAENIAFKLDLVLCGESSEALLDTYQTEREPHVVAVIEKGIELGRVQTMRDPVAATARDQTLLANRAAKKAPEKIRFPGIGPGLVAHDTRGSGELFPQGMVAHDGRRGRFDDVMGYGWLVLGTRDLETEIRAADLDLRCVVDEIEEADGVYGSWLNEHEARAVVVRPDFYVYGTARTGSELRALLAALEKAKRA